MGVLSVSFKKDLLHSLNLSLILIRFYVGTQFTVQDKYEYIKQIGHGAYGVVCSAIDHSIKAKVAIKKVPKAFEDLIDAKRIVREIKLLSKFRSYIEISLTQFKFVFCRVFRSREYYWSS